MTERAPRMEGNDILETWFRLRDQMMREGLPVGPVALKAAVAARSLLRLRAGGADHDRNHARDDRELRQRP